jgi:effector-binding domain-containing protein
MNCSRSFRLAVAALIPAAALLPNFALAQSPPTTPPAATSPATPAPAPVAPATPAAPATSTTPSPTAPAAAPSAPASPSTITETPAATPPAVPPVQTADAFGDEATLTSRQVVAFNGKANWDSAFETLIESFKQLSALLDKQGIKPSGNPMVVYTATDDTGFTFLTEIPVDQEVKNLSRVMSMTKSPEGKALKFVHRGSYDNMDNTYEAITNYLDDKKLEAKDTFIEEYLADPLKTAEDKLIINVYVPLK